MEEQKEKKDDVLGSGSESRTGGEHVGGESETLVEKMSCEGQIGGSFGDSVTGEGGEACNGEDIMVEVLGSDVFVDGVCREDGDEGKGSLIGEAVHVHSESVEASFEKDGKGSVVDGSGLRGVEGSGGEFLDNGIEGGVEGSSVVEKVPEQKIQVVAEEEVAVEMRGEVLVEKNVGEVGTLDGEDRDAGIGTEAEGSMVAEDSLGGENQVLVEEAAVIAEKEGSVVGNIEDGTERGGDDVAKEGRVLDNDVQTDVALVTDSVGGEIPLKDNEVQTDLALVTDSSGGEIQPSVDDTAMESEENSERGLAKEGVEHGNNLVDGGDDAVVDLKTQNECVLDNEAWNPGIESTTSSLTTETLAVQTQHPEKETTVMDNEEVAGGNQKALPYSDVEIKETGVLNEDLSCPGEELQEKAETVSEGTENDGTVSADVIASCHPNQVVVEPEVAGIDYKILADIEKGEQLKLEEQLDGTMADPAQIDSNIGQEMEVDPGEDTQISDRVEEIAVVENEVPSPIEKEQQLQLEEGSGNSMGAVAQVDTNVGQVMEVDEQVSDTEHIGLHGGQEVEVKDQVTGIEHSGIIDEKIVKQAISRPESSITLHQGSYQLPPENEGEFSVSDLVWGKVKSHPWWPGQIFDPSDSSEKAVKYCKKDCFLVAYFGDQTFAWNDASLLKPFRTHFSQNENQSNSETFQNSVNCALEEISRRVELGLTCSCISEDVYDNIRFQIIENTGIRQESSRRDGVDKSASANCFEPDKLVEYMKVLAQYPSGGADRLELVIAKAQLLAFYRLKGYHQLPEFQFCGELLENSADSVWSGDKMHLNEAMEWGTPGCEDEEKIGSDEELLKSQNGSAHKRKHNLKDVLYPRKKEKSMSELMDGTLDFPDVEDGSDGKASSKKRRAVESFVDDLTMQDGRKSISFAKVTTTGPPIQKPSFKIGECIRRVASQMTGSPVLKCNSERFQRSDGNGTVGDGFNVSFLDPENAESGMLMVSTEYSSLDDLLSQLLLTAQDPMKDYSFLNIIISFFTDFRNSVSVDQYASMAKAGGKRKQPSRSFYGFHETFEFEDMNDTYWTDRVIANGSEEQPSSQKRRGEYQISPVILEKSPQGSRRSYSRKRYSYGDHDFAADKPAWYLDEKKRETTPAELIMSFSDVHYVPSEFNLNKMFKCFGPLKESETEVDRVTNRARVVFKRCIDAEVAFSSAGRFNIFGPTTVNYQLSYSPSTLFKDLPIAVIEGHEDAMQLDVCS